MAHDRLDEAQQKLETLAELACAQARKHGAQQAAARATWSLEHKVLVRDGKWEEIKASGSRNLSLQVYVDGRYGTHATSILESAALEAFIGRAVEMTRLLSVDAHRKLPDAKDCADRSRADLGLYDPAHAGLDMAARKQRAMAAHDAARAAAGDKLLSAEAGAGDRVSLGVQRTTDGFADAERSTSFSTWAGVSAKDAGGKRPSDWDQDRARMLSRLIDPAQVGRQAAARTLATLGTGKIDTQTLPLIIENRAVGRLLGGLLSPLSGWALDQKRSCFEGSLDQPVGSEKLHVIDDPLLVGGWGSHRFDNEGLTARPRPVFEKGLLRTYFIDSYYARKLDRSPTSGGTSNLIFTPGPRDLDALCAAAGRAILVTGFLGGNSNGTTGDFSHGIQGFLIEGGKRTRPISSMNIAGNHKTFWKGLAELGSDPYPFAAQRTPSMAFGPVTVAGR